MHKFKNYYLVMQGISCDFYKLSLKICAMVKFKYI